MYRFLIILLALGVGISLLPSVGAASQASYSVRIACSANTPYSIVGHVDTIWNWTVNGVKMNGGYIFCNSYNGGDIVTSSGLIPAKANGIVATMFAQRFCENTAMTSQSFSPGSAPSIKLSAGCTGVEYKNRVSINASFILS